ncbi:MAG: hypothetical protein HYT03_00540 [Candidatus Harrisonbacteria bacterium]|nr:hypothetical protein [Candidatus Harrisonbacteria bacterium]
MSKKIVILYHGECMDGTGGGWAAWKKFGNKADYYGLKHGDSLPSGLKGKEIYVVDFSFKEPLMQKIVRENKKVIALDHHVSAKKSTKMAHEYVYELNKSGAMIAWQYFHPNKKVPRLTRHIQDLDLWKFKVPGTKELTAYVQMIDLNFKNFDKIARDLENSKRRRSYFEKGGLLLRYEKEMIERLLKGAETVKFAGRKILAVNSPVLHSEVGAELVKKKPPIALVWSEKSGALRISLRSNGKVDVSKIAARYGGGGHKPAAGFSFPINKPKPWKIIKN